MTATRSISEITAELKTARAAFDRYNKVQFEGCGNPDNYYLNPHHVAIEALSAELRAIEQAAVTDKLSGDSLKAEQAWFNSQQFRFPDVAQKACNARGYNLQDLFDAAKKAKQAA